MSLKSEFARGLASIAGALALGALAIAVSGWLRAEGYWPSARPGQFSPAGPDRLPARAETADPGIRRGDADEVGPVSGFEAVLADQLSWGIPILEVFALCHGRTRLETGDSEFRHSRVEGVDWLEYYESAALPGGEIAIRGFRAPMNPLHAATQDGVLVITAGPADFVGGAWHVTAAGEIDDAIQLEPAPGLAITACRDAGSAAVQLNAVFRGDHGGIRARRHD